MMWIRFQQALTITSLKANVSGQKAQIQARPSGIWATILHLLGLGSVHIYSISPAGFRKEIARFSGDHKVFVPRRHVSASVFVSSKPVEYLAIAFAFVIFGLGGLGAPGDGKLVFFLIGMAVAAGMVLVYFLTARRTTLGIITDAGTEESIRLKASGSDLEDLRDVIDIIETLIRTNEGDTSADKTESSESDRVRGKPRESASDWAGQAGGRSLAAVEDEIISCPHCGTRMQITAAHRGRQIRCPSCRDAFQA